MLLAHESLPTSPAVSALHGSPSSIKQPALQPSPAMMSPSSQPSPSSRRPLPHVSAGSHTGGCSVVSHTPLSQSVSSSHGPPFSTSQPGVQPSPVIALPSSQPSPA